MQLFVVIFLTSLFFVVMELYCIWHSSYCRHSINHYLDIA